MLLHCKYLRPQREKLLEIHINFQRDNLKTHLEAFLALFWVFHTCTFQIEFIAWIIFSAVIFIELLYAM